MAKPSHVGKGTGESLFWSYPPFNGPAGNEFNARHCTAYQGIIRFAWEKFLESQFG